MLAPRLKRLRAWAAVHWIRSAFVAGAIVASIAASVAAWTYLARLALQSGQVPLATALEALDQGRYEEARSLVSRMLTSGHLPRGEFGGAMFVLGAVKTNDAELSPTASGRRVDYLVAARYLTESRDYGLPEDREKTGLFLLGKSLLESNQFDEGILVLEELLAAKLSADEPLAWETLRLLAETCLWMPTPNYNKALSQSEALLKDAGMTADRRVEVLLQRAECLARLGRFEEARQAIAAIPSAADSQTHLLLARAQLVFDELESRLESTPAQEHSAVAAEFGSALTEAMQWLQEAGATGRDKAIAARAGYLRGRGLSLQGDLDGALREFSQSRQMYGERAEGVASALCEAELLRRRGDDPAALLGYRRVLESLPDPPSYRSVVLPLARIRKGALEALADFVDRRRFDEALALLSHFSQLFEPDEQLEFRGETLKQWGELLLTQVSEPAWEASETRTAGLRRLREAGVAYEQLAELRFATSSYTDELWTAAEQYFRGHSYTRAIRLLNKYIHFEPERRNAQALLRLGQSYLALGKLQPGIDAFEECIEFHPRDGSTYQARIDCAKAYWHRGEMDAAERLLRDNIEGSELKPSSREWKDSKFELGMLLYENGQYERAIDHLEQAIERYPQDPQKLLAQYVLGESYRGWAEEMLERARTAKTATERERNDQVAKERLHTALGQFVDVQRAITLNAQDAHGDPLMAAMRRNCYMLAGAVLFDLGRHNDAINMYSNVSSLLPNDPFVLETFVQIANCWRRLGRGDNARGAIQQAQIALDRLPPDADFSTSTPLNREEWRLLLGSMSRW
jgi:tetratricopeptide (TPR) repeat protein